MGSSISVSTSHLPGTESLESASDAQHSSLQSAYQKQCRNLLDKAGERRDDAASDTHGKKKLKRKNEPLVVLGHLLTHTKCQEQDRKLSLKLRDIRPSNVSNEVRSAAGAGPNATRATKAASTEIADALATGERGEQVGAAHLVAARATGERGEQVGAAHLVAARATGERGEQVGAAHLVATGATGERGEQVGAAHLVAAGATGKRGEQVDAAYLDAVSTGAAISDTSDVTSGKPLSAISVHQAAVEMPIADAARQVVVNRRTGGAAAESITSASPNGRRIQDVTRAVQTKSGDGAASGSVRKARTRVGVENPGDVPLTTTRLTTPHERPAPPLRRAPTPDSTRSVHHGAESQMVADDVRESQGTQVRYSFKTWDGQPAVRLQFDASQAAHVVTAHSSHERVQTAMERSVDQLASGVSIEFERQPTDDEGGRSPWGRSRQEQETDEQ
ncbi:SpaN/EivJ family type III secretion system needle length determinant [Burkholderia pyrrocinia]